MPTQLAQRWFADYDESHRHPANLWIHWISVPVIFFCLLGFAWAIPVPETWENYFGWFRWSFVAIPVICLCYMRLSLILAVGMVAFMALCYDGLLHLELEANWPVWKLCVAPFVLAGIAQLVGRQFEKKPLPLLKSVLLFVVGPAWLMSLICRRVGLKY